MMKKIVIFVLSVATPFVLFAESNADSLLDLFLQLINYSIYLVFGLAIVIFFWGLAMFILNDASAGEHQKGISLMIWGIVVFFVMASVWGLVTLLQQTFGVSNSSDLKVPIIDASSIHIDS